MIKQIANGIGAFNKLLSKENLQLFEDLLKKGEKFIENIDSINEDLKNNTEYFCEILEIDLLNKNTLKELIKNYGTKDYTSVALLKGEYDKQKDRRVFFMQKLNKENEPINKREILCIYVNNIEIEIQELFNNKPLLIIK